MRHSNRSIVLLLFLSALSFSGCRNSSASPNGAGPSSSAASLAKPSAGPSSAQSFAHLSKHPPRDSEFSVYRNPSYGISFRYPRNYVLLEPKSGPQQEALHNPEQASDQTPNQAPEQAPQETKEQDSIDSADSDFLLTQQSLEADQPGGHLVASVLIPDDAYPNTTFAGGHLQFVVNPHATAESCRAVVAPPDSASAAALHDLFLQDIRFQWRDRGSSAPSIHSDGREYAGFFGGACYEFFLQAVSTPSADSDHPASRADLAKILRPLEKSVSSFHLHPASQSK
jgi:hypothetical protein